MSPMKWKASNIDEHIHIDDVHEEINSSHHSELVKWIITAGIFSEAPGQWVLMQNIKHYIIITFTNWPLQKQVHLWIHLIGTIKLTISCNWKDRQKRTYCKKDRWSEPGADGREWETLLPWTQTEFTFKLDMGSQVRLWVRCYCLLS